MNTKNLRRILIATCSVVALSGCGANDIASPGTGGNVTINNITPAPTPTPTPSPTPTATLVQPAIGCPTIDNPAQLVDAGTVSGPTGTWRVCNLPRHITRTTTLVFRPGLIYQMNGRVDMGFDAGPTAPTTAAPRTVVDLNTNTNVTLTADPNAVLNIEPGVILMGAPGASWLGVNRGNTINAVGTPTRPIIFTSRDNVLGLNTDTSAGQWGGVVLLGRAQITDCAAPTAVPGTTACERQTEGAVDPSLYGGATNTGTSGRMQYVQIRYSGFVLSANTELQALTTEGTGSGTQISYIQSFNSSDDGAEFFGGRVNFRYFISVGALDDNLDTDTGLKANFQYVIVAQRAGSEPLGADSIIEADSDNTFDQQLPRQNTIVSNFVFLARVASANNSTAILLRGGTDYTLINGFMDASASQSCLRISRAATADTTASLGVNSTNVVVSGATTGNDELGAPVFRSVQFRCPTTALQGINGVTDAQVAAIFNAGTATNNSITYTPTLTNGFVNGATEAAVPVFAPANLHAASGIPSTTGGLGGQTAFFDAVTYAGAVRDANDTWYTQWTCNSSILNLGTGNTGLCTTLPVFS